MNLFFDTSALVKFFHEEKGTDIVMEEHTLKALDALHLGAFSLISEKDWSFVVADDKLCKVAEVIGFTTINPLKESAK